jgi:hypothetical protein
MDWHKTNKALEDWLRRQLKCHALAIASLERTMTRLRSRLNWLKEGDANTSYFQQHARYRKKKNFVAKLKVGDRIIVDQEKEAVWDFYNNLLGTASQRALALNLQAFHRPDLDLGELDAFIMEEEVWNTIKLMPLDKASGPDGLTERFFKVAWQIIKVDFMAAISRLMQGDVSRLHLLNSAYITLFAQNGWCSWRERLPSYKSYPQFCKNCHQTLGEQAGYQTARLGLF